MSLKERANTFSQMIVRWWEELKESDVLYQEEIDGIRNTRGTGPWQNWEEKNQKILKQIHQNARTNLPALSLMN